MRYINGSPALVVHAGAGTWEGGVDNAIAACEAAVERGQIILQESDSVLDAVVAAVTVLEDDPCCNAGTGSVQTSVGTYELDACVMDGLSLLSGAVGALPSYRNPILIAKTLLLDGAHHLLVGLGAAAYAEERGFHALEPGGSPPQHPTQGRFAGDTVGAVAVNSRGHLAAATSTGGVQGQPPGRIGDTPLVGAGTYADDRAASSCTGDGDAFARACCAFWAVDNVARGAQAIAETALDRTQNRFHGTGGIILISRSGDIGIACTMPKMPFAFASATGAIVTGVAGTA